MSSTKQKLRLAAAFAALAMLALAISCRGFFVNPTLTAITISPTSPEVEVGTTLVPALLVYGTYNDGSTGVVSSGVSWSSASPTVATISAGGSLTGVALGTASISASAQAVTGSASATVFLGGVTGLSVSPTSSPISNSGTETILTFTATANGQQVEVTTNDGALLTITPTTTSITCTPSEPQEICTSDGTATVGTVYSVVMTYPGSTATATATLTVTD